VVRARLRILRELIGGRLSRRLGLHGGVRIGRAEPLSRKFGLDRGTPLDRFYIERFLVAESAAIGGRVLEIGDATYTKRYGNAVERSDVLHATAGNPDATIVGDLATGENVPSAAFDCIILTQTLPFVFDVQRAAAGVLDALAPGGTALVTLPGISQISRFDMDRWGDFWRFTDASARRLFGEGFDRVDVQTHGNVAAACAFLYGFAAEELEPEVLAHTDPDYQLLITVAARRAAA
jgi:SAM-dependent methyltransferase